MPMLRCIATLAAAILLGGLAAAERAPLSVKSLLVWGGADADGKLFLHPAFVIKSPPTLPSTAGDYGITGRTGGGDEIFAFSFTMSETADGDGSSSFSFALPAEPDWSERLASIELTGPGGSYTLDAGSDHPMAILLNPRTGQVRGILRDPLAAAEATASQSSEVLFSRGIPDAEAWRR